MYFFVEFFGGYMNMKDVCICIIFLLVNDVEEKLEGWVWGWVWF